MSYGGSQYGSSSRQDEDWSRIEDPNERRKVQNRIAQRNYRKLPLNAFDTLSDIRR